MMMILTLRNNLCICAKGKYFGMDTVANMDSLLFLFIYLFICFIFVCLEISYVSRYWGQHWISRYIWVHLSVLLFHLLVTCQMVIVYGCHMHSIVSWLLPFFPWTRAEQGIHGLFKYTTLNKHVLSNWKDLHGVCRSLSAHRGDEISSLLNKIMFSSGPVSRLSVVRRRGTDKVPGTVQSP